VVYRARDDRLDRDVALKFLAAAFLSREDSRKRLRLEARALSRLNHPSVAAVYDFDSEGGVDYLVMEFVAGETLGDRLQRGPLPERDVVVLGLQLAEGLAEAHRAGVLHRDLKPGNLRVTPEGRLKILDFGLARFTQAMSAEAKTESALETQGVVGTLPYMAPEQLRDVVVDARSDIYAAGAVLYEMATGRRPFTEPVTAVLTDAILHTAPPMPGRLQPDLSPGLETIILKCLEKDPALRYQSAVELVVDLKRLAGRSSDVRVSPAVSRAVAGAPWRISTRAVLTAALVVIVVAALVGFDVGRVRSRLFRLETVSGVESLAVLPLSNVSGDAAQDYFAAGMTEALTSAVSNIPAARSIPHCLSATPIRQCPMIGCLVRPPGSRGTDRWPSPGEPRVTAGEAT